MILSLRTTAFFFAAFALVNHTLGLLLPGFDANLWWLDLRMLAILSEYAPTIALLFTAGGLLHFALRGPRAHSTIGGRAAYIALWALLVLIVQNVVQYYALLFSGMIRSAFPVPLSLFILLPVAGILRECARPRMRAIGYRPLKSAMLSVLTLAALSVLFPLAQMVCFGATDYRRPADLVVVFGARAYADGRMSTALFDRARTGVDLYKGGLAGRLFFSGGPGDGEIHEVEAMRNYALKRAVDPRDIVLDRAGLSTVETVENSAKFLRENGYTRVLAVSQFYHLPRIKLSYARAGFDVYTVPAKKSRLIVKLPLLMTREVAAFWYYYLRPLAMLVRMRVAPHQI